jgi:hypothetical protein
MSANLQTFLTLTDLDELYTARETLDELDAPDRATLETILTQWEPAQAVANLLLYPELIPNPLQFPALLRGFDEPTVKYYALAATVGLARLKASQFSAEQRAQLAQRLLQLVRTGDPLIASRAAITFGQYLSRADAVKIVELFNQPEATVRHNLLTALIQLVGLNHIRSVLESARTSPQLSPAARAFLEENQSSLAPFFHDDTVDALGFVASPLSTPLLAYLPNLNDYRAAPAPPL